MLHHDLLSNCITHLPHIAAYADSHFLIEKHVEQGRTMTRVTKLDREGRVAELGRMLGGAKVSPQLLESARQMLDERQAPRDRVGVGAGGGLGGHVRFWLFLR